MKKKIIFITGNPGKLREAKSIIPQIVGKELDLPEIQETDARKVIEAKLLEARKYHRGEYVIEDTSLYLDCINGLPGPLIKWFLEKIEDRGLYEIARRFGDYGAQAKTIVGYINDKGQIKYFEGSVAGKIVKPRGEGGFGWDKIFLPDGHQKTFGQMPLEEKNKISMRKKAFKKLAKYLQS